MTRTKMSAVLVPLALIVSGSAQAQNGLGNDIPTRVAALEALTASLQQQITAQQTVNSTQSGQISELQNQIADLQSALAGISVTEAQTGSAALPANTFMQLATLTLPAGNYAFSGQIEGRPYNNVASTVGGGCQLVSASGPPIGGGNATLTSFYFEISPIGTLALPSGGAVWLQCVTKNANSVIIDSSTLVAAKLPTLN
jgi:cytochrome bd-type quinol oxidase subunit 1